MMDVFYDRTGNVRPIYRVQGPNGRRISDAYSLDDAMQIKEQAELDAKKLGYDDPEHSFIILVRHEIMKMYADNWTEVIDD